MFLSVSLVYIRHSTWILVLQDHLYFRTHRYRVQFVHASDLKSPVKSYLYSDWDLLSSYNNWHKMWHELTMSMSQQDDWCWEVMVSLLGIASASYCWSRNWGDFNWACWNVGRHGAKIINNTKCRSKSGWSRFSGERGQARFQIGTLLQTFFQRCVQHFCVLFCELASAVPCFYVLK